MTAPGAIRPHPGRLRFRLTIGPDGVRLTLAKHPRGTAPALAYGLGCGLSYEGRLPPGDLGAGLLELGRSWNQLPPEEAAPSEIRARLQALVEKHLPGAALSEDDPSTGSTRWPVGLRIADTEAVALEEGLRRAIKRELVRPGDERDILEAASRRGWCAEPVLDEAGTGTVILALDRRTALQVAEYEREARSGGPTYGDAARKLGDALGYPACCTRAYAAADRRDDTGLAEVLLPPLPTPAAPPESLWLNPPLALISHAACRPDCTESRRIGTAIRDSLERREPGFAARWKELAARVHVLDDSGSVFGLRLDQAPATPGSRRIVGAFVCDPNAPGGAVMKALESWAGLDCLVGDGGLSIPAKQLRSKRVANHHD